MGLHRSARSRPSPRGAVPAEPLRTPRPAFPRGLLGFFAGWARVPGTPGPALRLRLGGGSSRRIRGPAPASHAIGKGREDGLEPLSAARDNRAPPRVALSGCHGPRTHALERVRSPSVAACCGRSCASPCIRRARQNRVRRLARPARGGARQRTRRFPKRSAFPSACCRRPARAPEGSVRLPRPRLRLPRLDPQEPPHSCGFTRAPVRARAKESSVALGGIRYRRLAGALRDAPRSHRILRDRHDRPPTAV